jgi:hypothetical protein
MTLCFLLLKAKQFQASIIHIFSFLACDEERVI